MKKLTEKQKIKKVLDKIGVSYKVKSTTEDLKKLIETTKHSVQNVINHHEKHKSSYFWSPPSSAHQRRSEESKKSFTVKIGRFEYESDVSCSCKNYYYTGSFYENDVKKNLRTFKKLRDMLDEI